MKIFKVFYATNTMMYIDSLTTTRLITRKLVMEDHTAWADFFADATTTRFIMTLGETDHTKRAIAWINKQMARYANGNGGLQALLNRTTGELIGQCGILIQEIDGVQELEIGYHILPQFRGLGYATEAAQKFKEYVFENSLAGSVISIIHRENIASQKVAVKNGMTREKETELNATNVYVYRITEQEYKSRL